MALADHIYSFCTRRSTRLTLGFLLAVSALPFLCLLMFDHALRSDGWNPWSSRWYAGVMLLLIAGSILWARHFFRGVPRFGLILAIFSMALVWKTIRVDWIVKTNYEYMGQPEHRTYTPPISPLWSPPKPQELSRTATSWRDFEFFYIGGAGGPTEEPYLRVNWPLALIKFTSVTIVGYLFLLLSTRIYERFRLVAVA